MTHRTLLLYTGGTIGMKMSADGYVPDPEFQSVMGPRAAGMLPPFDYQVVDEPIDSSNATPAEWWYIAKLIRAAAENYDGFVVLHGTDTMAYTASALSFLLRGLNKPVIVTGSQIPLNESRTDALENLTTALMLAEDNRIPEVCIYFHGHLLRGNRTRKCSSRDFVAFESPNYPLLAKVGSTLDVDIRQMAVREPGIDVLGSPAPAAGSVAVQWVFPGMGAAAIRALNRTGVRAVILMTYGAGTFPFCAELHDALQSLVDGGVVLLSISQCPHGMVDQARYAASGMLNQLGVVAGGDMTLEAALAKLTYLIAANTPSEQMTTLLTTDICGELTVSP